MITVQCRRYLILHFSMRSSRLGSFNGEQRTQTLLVFVSLNKELGEDEVVESCFIVDAHFPLLFAPVSVIHEVKCARGQGTLFCSTLLCRYASRRLDSFAQSDGGGHLHFPLLELRILPKATVSVPKL